MILAFTVCAYEDLDLHPWRLVQGSSMMAGKPNAWREGPDKRDCMRGRRAVARYLMTSLIDQGFDVANAYKPLHHESLAHAFTNAILYLDYDRTGRDYPTTSVPITC